MSSENKTPNRLAKEKSPYLLQHAYNPVDWFPWGEEAFAKATAEDKPVFLSIGYSTCHWCHVMEGESFEDDEVAALLNQNYVPVKVDREERPDIDAVYMSVCQAMTGEGGWPLTILMTPEQKPFFAGTYFPKRARYGRVGLTELLEKASRQWRSNRNALIQSGEQITQAMREQGSQPQQQGQPSRDLAIQAAKMLRQVYDPVYGGFGSAPKFPTPHNLLFLVRYQRLANNPKAGEIVEKTLRQMYRGGLFDHIGYGFSRYSTDRLWLVPHFEKMLYDNALLMVAYAQAYQATGDDFYRDVVQKTFQYIQREMTHPEGGFYCAQDADSEGKEGKYYLFTPDEVIQVLGQSDGELFNRYFDITPEGNFEGKNIPNLIGNESYDQKNPAMDDRCAKLYPYRRSRFSLRRDDKILSGWNALMIAALSIACRCLGEETYLKAALRALEMMDRRLYDERGVLQASYRDGQTSGAAHLDDYSYLCWACLELYQTTHQVEYLERGVKTAGEMIDGFWDQQQGGFFLSGQGNEKLILQTKEWYDGALPSGNSVAAYCLVMLEKLTGEAQWRELAEKQLLLGASEASSHPMAYCFYHMALLMEVYPSQELICVLPDGAPVEELKDILNASFRPNLTVLVVTPENAQRLHALAPFTRDYPVSAQPAFYLCQNGACSAPVTDPAELKKALDNR